MLEATARIAPSQPNQAMARIAPRSPMVPKFYSTQARFFGLDSKLFSKFQIDSKSGLGSKGVAHHAPRTTQPRSAKFHFCLFSGVSLFKGAASRLSCLATPMNLNVLALASPRKKMQLKQTHEFSFTGRVRI
jgi:hypothetical protein